MPTSPTTNVHQIPINMCHRTGEGVGGPRTWRQARNFQLSRGIGGRHGCRARRRKTGGRGPAFDRKWTSAEIFVWSEWSLCCRGRWSLISISLTIFRPKYRSAQLLKLQARWRQICGSVHSVASQSTHHARLIPPRSNRSKRHSPEWNFMHNQRCRLNITMTTIINNINNYLTQHFCKFFCFLRV